LLSDDTIAQPVVFSESALLYRLFLKVRLGFKIFCVADSDKGCPTGLVVTFITFTGNTGELDL